MQGTPACKPWAQVTRRRAHQVGGGAVAQQGLHHPQVALARRQVQSRGARAIALQPSAITHISCPDISGTLASNEE